MSNLSKLNLPVKNLQSGEIVMQEFDLPSGGSELPFDLVINNGVYGYERLDGTFVPFKSQADIDSAVAAAMVGTATAGDVLTGKTFTNSSTSGANGSMANNGAVSASLNTGTTSYTIPAGYHNGSGTVSIATQEKSATPSTSAQNITPDSGKVLSKVSVSAISTQEKTSTPTTRSATAATITPDSGKYLSKVTVNTNSVPNSNNGTYTFPVNDTGGTKDLGDTNSYRYVNAQNVYNKGKADGAGLKELIGVTYGSNCLNIFNLKTNECVRVYVSSGPFTLGSVTVTINGTTVTFNKPCKVGYFDTDASNVVKQISYTTYLAANTPFNCANGAYFTAAGYAYIFDFS